MKRHHRSATRTAHPDGWLELAGDGVTVLSSSRAHPEARVVAELRAAERIVAALAGLLDVSARRRKLAGPARLILLDQLGNTADQDIVERAGALADAALPYPNLPIRLSLASKAQTAGPAESPIGALVRLLLGRWLGPQALTASILVDGLIGQVAASVGVGPRREAVDARLRAAVEDGEPISVLGRPVTDADSWPDPAATSFVGYLLDAHGATALRRCLAELDPARPEGGILTVYEQPLEALESRWRRRLTTSSVAGASRTLFRQLPALVRPYWTRQLEVLAYMLFELAYGLALPLATMRVIDEVIPSGDALALLGWMAALLAGYLLDSVIGLRRAYVNDWINERIVLGLRRSLFARIQRLPHQFFGDARVGDLMARLFSDLDVVGQALSQVAGVGVFLALRAVVTAVVLIALSPPLGALILVVVPCFGGAYLLLQRRLEEASYEYQSLGGEAEAAAQENLSAHATVKAFGLEDRAVSSFGGSLAALLRASLRLTLVGALFETSMSLAITFGELLVLGAGGFLVMRGELSLGTLVAFVGLLSALFHPIGMLSNVGQTVQKASGALSRVQELLDEPVTIADRPGVLPVCQHVGELRFEGVSFGYTRRQSILRDLSLRIPSGRHVAIVGSSGAGKSTLVNLLLRFWEPVEGRITLDGRDLRDIQLASLRDQIGVVLQDTFIFDTTLRENIALGRPGATDAEIVAAARAAQLDEYVRSLPSAYDTQVGERGVRMSGGQRQRLAIARALLRDPRILILDEPTSALDATTERELLATLDRLAEGRTTISITHRLSLAAAADLVVVLDQGRVVEQGTHAELLRRDGPYRRLYQEQVAEAVEPARSEPPAQILSFPGHPDTAVS